VLEKSQIGDFGFYAFFTDVEGNLMALWENATKK
jgi:predicted enzyme related to lactoylglutathione lyase